MEIAKYFGTRLFLCSSSFAGQDLKLIASILTKTVTCILTKYIVIIIKVITAADADLLCPEMNSKKGALATYKRRDQAQTSFCLFLRWSRLLHYLETPEDV